MTAIFMFDYLLTPPVSGGVIVNVSWKYVSRALIRNASRVVQNHACSHQGTPAAAVRFSARDQAASPATVRSILRYGGSYNFV